MILHHIRIQKAKDTIRGVLLRHDPKVEERIEWICELLEDIWRQIKVHGKTAIDAKTYEIVPIQYGKFYDKFAKKGDLFAIALMDKKGIDKAGRHSNVRVHPGADEDDTDGCPLTANRVDYDPKQKDFFVVPGSSTPAYRRLYALLLTIYDKETNTFKEPAFWQISEQYI